MTRLHRDGSVETRAGRVRAGAAVLAVNSAAAGFPGYRLSLAVASSHIVLTEPIPDVLDELGWTGGEAIVDSRTLVHYTRTTRDGRIVFGWGGGAMGLGGRGAGRLELDRAVIAVDPREHSCASSRRRAGGTVTHAWGGPIDVSPTHLPIFGSRGRIHHGFGFTGNGVGPSYLGGEILARLALDRRDERTALAIVEPGRKLFPPEPFRYAGGSLIRRALMAKDTAEDAGRSRARQRGSSRRCRAAWGCAFRARSRLRTEISSVTCASSHRARSVLRGEEGRRPERIRKSRPRRTRFGSGDPQSACRNA